MSDKPKHWVITENGLPITIILATKDQAGDYVNGLRKLEAGDYKGYRVKVKKL